MSVCKITVVKTSKVQVLTVLLFLDSLAGNTISCSVDFLISVNPSGASTSLATVG